MTKKELHEYLVKNIGINYRKYSECVEYYLKILNYRNKYKPVDISV